MNNNKELNNKSLNKNYDKFVKQNYDKYFHSNIRCIYSPFSYEHRSNEALKRRIRIIPFRSNIVIMKND
jgi:hypothetical protein